MADREIVIKIPEEQYKYILWSDNSAFADLASKEMMMHIIKNGIPLPKGHGKLKDVDDLDITTVETDDYSGNEILDVVLKEDIDEAPTIIPADESEEG